MENTETLEVLKGTVCEVTYRNRDNSYTVLKIKVNKEEIIATGLMPYVCEGEAVVLHGQYVIHPIYGQQFKCEICEVSVPETSAQILKYLSSGSIKGIGPATALKIVELFKEDTLNIIENEPTRLTVIKGVSTEKAMSISEQYKQQFGIRDIMLSLSKFKISPNEAGDIFKTLGANSINLIKTNPYCLCSEGIGFSFERADEIAEQLNIAPESSFRVTAGIIYVLRSNLMNGHTCLPKNKLTDVTSKLLCVELNCVADTIETLCDSFQLFSYMFNETEFIFLPEYAEAEEYISGRIKSIINNNIQLPDASAVELELLQNRLGIVFDPVQVDSVNEAMRNSLFILTGGPGTGKSATRSIVK